MSIPGANILNMALRIIAKQAFSYFAFLARNLNYAGQNISIYAAPIDLTGSVQAVPRELFEKFGLDLQKEYLNFFLPNAVLDVTRDVSGDLMLFNGQLYQALSKTDWFPQDGWVSVLCVKIPNNPFVTTLAVPADGNYVTSNPLNFTINFSFPVAVSGSPRFVLTIGTHTRYAYYVSESGSNTLVFSYMVVSGDSAPSGISVANAIDLNSGSINGSGTGIGANVSFIQPNLSGVTVNA